MALVGSSELLKKAQQGRYAIGAFNAENMEMVQAIIDAADEMKSPVIIQTTPSTVAYAGPDMYQKMVSVKAEEVSVPVVMHLDHGNSFELCRRSVESGYTSIMIDGSGLSYNENVELSRRTADMARAEGVDTAAELGTVGGKEDSHEVSDKDALYTNPAQAVDFIARTGIQSLAVAIGTAHGFYKGEPRLDFDRLSEIRNVVSIPLVLHGASGVPDEMIKMSVELGICKVNFATELRAAYTKGVRSILKEDGIFDPKKYSAAGREAVRQLVKEKILLLGSEGSAL